MFYELLRTVQLDSSVRQTIQSQLVELAQLPSRYLPADALLSGLELLDPAERITVTDRIAADATVNDGSWTQRESTGPNISTESAIRAFEAIPETRRPALIMKVADALLRELDPPEPRTSRDRPSADAKPGRLRPDSMSRTPDVVHSRVVDLGVRCPGVRAW